jgi:hypothetical protein
MQICLMLSHRSLVVVAVFSFFFFVTVFPVVYLVTFLDYFSAFYTLSGVRALSFLLAFPFKKRSFSFLFLSLVSRVHF